MRLGLTDWGWSIIICVGDFKFQGSKMLTATYSLVAISAEQQNARTALCRLQEHVQGCLEGMHELDLPQVESALNKLAQFDQYCHSRKVERFVIPAVRGATNEIDFLLAELESLSAHGIDILRNAREQLQQMFEQGVIRLSELCSSLKFYCDNLHKRLAKEEEELLPMVGRLLSIDQWFVIAAQFMSDDAAHKRRSARATPALLLSA
jgi:hemerythrin-like domain-containing protein